MSAAWPRTCRLFLFDLDGTLIDSKEDIARSVNLTLARLQLSQIPVRQVATFVGDGVQKLIERSLRQASGREPDSQEVSRGITLFLQEYEGHLLDSTRLYPGVESVLDRLSWASLAVVSNKPERLSRRILEGLAVDDRFCVILGGDSTPFRKPDPAPLRHAMALCRAAPHESVMVGDSPVDINAGHSAGTMTCGISGGFGSRRELEAAGCDVVLEGLHQLPDFFQPS
jgi:phosphoglycolate phosphatase